MSAEPFVRNLLAKQMSDGRFVRVKRTIEMMNIHEKTPPLSSSGGVFGFYKSCFSTMR